MATKRLITLAFVLAMVYGLFVKNSYFLQSIVVNVCLIISTAVIGFYFFLKLSIKNMVFTFKE